MLHAQSPASGAAPGNRPIQDDEHFLIDLAYIERNALRAGLVRLARDGRWQKRIARALRLTSTFRDRERPREQKEAKQLCVSPSCVQEL